MMMPKCTGSMPNVLIDRQEDRRADQQHRRQVHEGAEDQQQDVDESRNVYLSSAIARKNSVALAGTRMIAIM